MVNHYSQRRQWMYCVLWILIFMSVVNDLEQKEQTIAQLQEQVRELYKQIQIQSDSMKSVGD